MVHGVLQGLVAVDSGDGSEHFCLRVPSYVSFGVLASVRLDRLVFDSDSLVAMLSGTPPRFVVSKEPPQILDSNEQTTSWNAE